MCICSISVSTSAAPINVKSSCLFNISKPGYNYSLKNNYKWNKIARCKSYLPKEDQQIKMKLEEYLNAAVKYNNFQGAVLVEKEGKVILSKGYGMADYENTIQNTSSTRFAIGSITKQFTAMAIMQLYERGRLKLDDKLSRYYPDFPRGNEITIHQLLSHTSGIVNYTMLPEYWQIDPYKITKDDIFKLLYNNPLDFKPGERWNYSNSGYVLLSDIVEKITGKSYEEYLDKNIFKPLRMKNSGLCMSRDKLNIKTVGYDGYLDIQPVDDTMSFRGSFGAGSLYSTVEDLYLWEKALDTEKLVSKKTMNKIFTPYFETFMGAYGYGWYIKGEDKEKTAFHDGIIAGFHSIISKYIGINSASIILSNKSINGSTIYKVENDINSILLGKDIELPKEKATIRLDVKKIDRLLGTYNIEPGYDVVITREGEHTYVTFTGMERIELYPISETEFFLRNMDLTCTFEIGENNEAKSIEINQRGTIYKAIK